MTGLLDRPPALTGAARSVSLLDPDMTEAFTIAREKWELDRREQDEAAIAEILRESLKKIYGDVIEEPKEPADTTKRRYISEFAAFARFALLQHALPHFDPPRSLPARPELVASYLHSLISGGAHSTRLRSASAAISRAHRLAQLPDPTCDVLVAGVLRAARQKAQPKKRRRRKKANGVHH